MALDPPNSLRRDESATAAPCIRDIDDTGTCFDQIMSEVAESVLENESGEEPIRRDTALRVLTAKCDHCVVFRANCVQALKALVDVTTQITNLEKLKPECELLRKQVAESQIQIEENLRTEHVMKARVTTAEAEASEAKARFEALEKDYDAMAKAAEEGKKHMQEAINWRLKYDRTVDVCEKLQEKRKANKESFNKILSLASNLQKDVQRCKLLRQKDKKKIAKLQSNLNRLTSAVRSYVPSLFNILETTMSSPFFKTEMPESVQVEAARLCSAEVQNVFGIDDTSVSIHVDEDDEGMTAELERLLCGVSNSSLSATNRMEFSDCPIGENLTNCSQVEHVMSDLSQLSDKEADSMLELGAEAATFSESRVIVREKSEGKKTIKKGRMTKDVGSLSATTIGANFDDFNRHYEELLATKLKRNDVTKESTKGAANSKHLSIHGKKTLSVRELQEAQMKVSIKEKVALMKLKDRERTHALGINSEDCCINDPLEQQMCSQISVQQDEKSASSNLKVNEYSLVREDLQMSSSPSPRSSVSEGETPDDITANVRTTSFLAMASEQDEESVARVFEDNEEDIEETDSSQHDLSDDVTDRRVQTKVPCVPNVCMHTQVSCIPNEADKNSLIEDLFEPKIAENCMLTETSSVENLTIKHAIIERSYGSNVTENILPAEMPSAREVIDKNSLTRVSFPPNISENTILTEESYSPNEADKALLTKDLLKSNIADNCMSTEASSIWNSTVKDAIIEGLSVSKVTDNIVTTEVASVTEVIDKNELTGVLLASNVSESTIPIDVSLPANVTDSHVLTEVQCGLNVTDSSTRSEVFCVPNEGDKTLLNEELFESNLSDNRMSTKASDVRNSTVKDAVIEEFSVSEITDKTVPREMPPVTEAIDRNVRPGVLFGSNVSESTTLSEEGSLTNVINSRVLSEVPCESNVTDICMRAEVSCIPNETDKTSAEVQSVSNLDGQCMQMEVPHTSNVTVSVLVTEGFPLSDFIHKATIAEMPSVVEVTDKNISTGVLFASNVCDKTTPTEQVAPASNLTKNVTQKRLLSSSDICSYTLRNFPVVTYATDMSMLEKETSFAQKMTNSAMFSEAPSELDTVIGKSFYGETDGERNADGLGDMFCEIPVNGKKVTTSQLLCKSVGSETVSRKESMAVISEVVRIEQSGSNISVFPKKTGMEQLESVDQLPQESNIDWVSESRSKKTELLLPENTKLLHCDEGSQTNIDASFTPLPNAEDKRELTSHFEKHLREEGNFQITDRNLAKELHAQLSPCVLRSHADSEPSYHKSVLCATSQVHTVFESNDRKSKTYPDDLPSDAEGKHIEDSLRAHKQQSRKRDVSSHRIATTLHRTHELTSEREACESMSSSSNMCHLRNYASKSELFQKNTHAEQQFCSTPTVSTSSTYASRKYRRSIRNNSIKGSSQTSDIIASRTRSRVSVACIDAEIRDTEIAKAKCKEGVGSAKRKRSVENESASRSEMLPQKFPKTSAQSESASPAFCTRGRISERHNTSPTDGPPLRIRARTVPVAPKKRKMEVSSSLNKPDSDDEGGLRVVDDEEVRSNMDSTLVEISEGEKQTSEKTSKTSDIAVVEDASNIHVPYNNIGNRSLEDQIEVTSSTLQTRNGDSYDAGESPSYNSHHQHASTQNIGVLGELRQSASSSNKGRTALLRFNTAMKKQPSKRKITMMKTTRSHQSILLPTEFSKKSSPNSSKDQTQAIESNTKMEKNSSQFNRSNVAVNILDEVGDSTVEITPTSRKMESVLQKQLHGALMSDQKLEVIRKNLNQSLYPISNMAPKDFATTMTKCSLTLLSGDMWTIVQRNFRNCDSSHLHNTKEDTFLQIAQDLAGSKQIWVEYVKKMVVTISMQSASHLHTSRYVRLLMRALRETENLLTVVEKKELLRTALTKIFLEDMEIAVKATTFALLTPNFDLLDWMKDREDPFFTLLSLAITTSQVDGKVLLWAWFQQFSEELPLRNISFESIHRAFSDLVFRIDKKAEERYYRMEKDALIPTSDEEDTLIRMAIAYISPSSGSHVNVVMIIEPMLNKCLERIETALRLAHNDRTALCEAYVISNRLRLCIGAVMSALTNKVDMASTHDLCELLQRGIPKIRKLRDELTRSSSNTPWMNIYRNDIDSILNLIRDFSHYEI